MKYIVVIGDGMSDYPLRELGGKTPLAVADTPNMDYIASEGRTGVLRTIPEGMPPGSDIANLSILGYDPKECYTGRGPLEAGGMGVRLGDADVAFRCNLVTEENGRIVDHSGGHITTEEARELLEEVRRFGVGEFYAGIGYRHLFVLRNCDPDIQCDPPHDVVGEPISKHLIRPEDSEVAQMLNRLILSSRDVLSEHPVNIVRRRRGKRPANMIWLWGHGRRPKLEDFKEKYGLKAAMISEVNLIKGIGFYAGMEVVDVPGATGYYDTNYEGMAEYGLRALDANDFVYIHVEAPDEAGHAADIEAKIRTIEDLDRRLLGKVLDGAEGCKIAVLPDHPTPIEVRTHTPDPVPFAILAPGSEGDGVKFDEFSVKEGSLGFVSGAEFMRLLLTL